MKHDQADGPIEDEIDYEGDEALTEERILTLVQRELHGEGGTSLYVNHTAKNDCLLKDIV
jgi:hypothetical protein